MRTSTARLLFVFGAIDEAQWQVFRFAVVVRVFAIRCVRKEAEHKKN
jgi:hypothetical protein